MTNRRQSLGIKDKPEFHEFEEFFGIFNKSQEIENDLNKGKEFWQNKTHFTFRSLTIVGSLARKKKPKKSIISKIIF